MSEWVEVMKQSVVGIIVSIVIGSAFGFIYMALASANRNKDKLAVTMASAELKEFQVYDGTIVKGEQVRSAISQYEDRDYAIFLQTAKTKGKFANFCAVADGVTDPLNATSAVPVKFDSTNKVLTQTEGQYVNLAMGKNGESYVNSTLKVGITSRNNSPLYINPTVEFYSCVLKDENGSIKGIAFIQASATS